MKLIMENWRNYLEVLEKFPKPVFDAIINPLAKEFKSLRLDKVANLAAKQFKTSGYLVLDMDALDTGSMEPVEQNELSELMRDGSVVPCTESAGVGVEEYKKIRGMCADFRASEEDPERSEWESHGRSRADRLKYYSYPDRNGTPACEALKTLKFSDCAAKYMAQDIANYEGEGQGTDWWTDIWDEDE